ncbi:MAG TPA: GvpL/GvpF family gas vesicle protein [Streptosporangiaceae bacterium]
MAAEPGPVSAAQGGVWVYAVTAAAPARRLAGLIGVAGAPVRSVTEAGLSAAVSTVGEPPATLLADLAATAAAGRAHHRVVTHLAEAGPVVPIRLATVYPDDTTVAALLDRRRTQLGLMLDAFGDSQEWDVKIYLAPWAGPGDQEWSEVPADGLSWPGSGPRLSLAEDRAERIAAALSALALATRRRPVSAPLPGTAPQVLFDGAYLLDADRAREFASIVESVPAEHVALRAELTGPWPPYSFADR